MFIVMGKKNILLFIPFIVLIFFFTTLVYVANGDFLSVHDSSLLLLKSELQNGLLFFWNDLNFGVTSYLNVIAGFYAITFSYIFLSLGISTKIMQLIFYILISSLIFYSAWYFFYKAINLLKFPNSGIASLIGACFYSFNLYTITFWHGGVIDGTFFVFCIAPLILYIIISSLIEKLNLQKTLIIILCIFFTINTGPYAIALYLSLFLPWLLISFRKDLLPKRMPQILRATLIALLLSLVFIVPLGMQIVRNDFYAVSTGLSNYAFSSNGIIGMFRLFFEWTISESWGGRYFHSYYPYFASPIAIITIFLIWIISFISLIKFKKNKKNIQIFLIISLLISIFIAKANQQPFGIINDFFYSYVPLFGIFRTPDTKFGLPIILVLSFLITYSITVQRNKIINILIVTCVILQTWIFFSMVPILEVKIGDSYQRIVKIPSEYKEVAKIVNNDEAEGRILFYPGLSYTNYDFMNGYGITGQDILGKMIDRPKVYSDGFIMKQSEDQYHKLTNEFNPINLGDASIRYVYIRNDVNKINTIPQKINILTSKQLELIYQSELGTLFKVPDKYVKGYITLEYSGEEYKNLKVKKINPTKYNIQLSNIPDRNISIYFNSSFHKDWKLKSNEDITIHEHSLNNGFGNKWNISINSNNEDEVNIEMYFWPQKIFYITAIISLTILSIIIFMLYGLHKNSKK